MRIRPVTVTAPAICPSMRVGRIVLLRRNEAAIDEDREALIGLQRRHHPETGTFGSRCLHQRFMIVKEDSVDRNTAIGHRFVL